MEFIVAERIKVHPIALAHADRIDDPKVRAEIDELTRSFPEPIDY